MFLLLEWDVTFLLFFIFIFSYALPQTVLRSDGGKILKKMAIPSLQVELLENIENARHSKLLSKRFKILKTRACLSDVTLK